MKLTRRQLRKLITESFINEMPLIRPGGDMDPEQLSNIRDMIATGDEDNIASADEFAYMLGHDSEEFSKDEKRYADETFGTADNYYALTEADKALLGTAQNQDLFLVADNLAGISFTNKSESGNDIIPADKLLAMSDNITPNPGKEYTYYPDVDDKTVASMLSLAVLIMRFANTTKVKAADLENKFGILKRNEFGTYEFNYEHPIFGNIVYSFEGLLEEGKMIIKGFAQDDYSYSTLGLD